MGLLNRAVSRATISYPQTDAWLEAGNRGYRTTWFFDEPSQRDKNARIAYPEGEWDLATDGYEMQAYPEISAVAPRPIPLILPNTYYDTTKTRGPSNSGWWTSYLPTQTVGGEVVSTASSLWRSIGIQSWPTVDWLHFYDSYGVWPAGTSRGGGTPVDISGYQVHGHARLDPDFLPGESGSYTMHSPGCSFVFRMRRGVPAASDEENTNYSWVRLELRARMPAENVSITSYSLVIDFPGVSSDKATRNIRIGVSTDNLITEPTPFFELEATTEITGEDEEVFTFEVIDQHLIIAYGLRGQEMKRQAIYFPPEWRPKPLMLGDDNFFEDWYSNPDAIVYPSDPHIHVYGQAAAFNFTPMTFPVASDSVMRLRRNFHIDTRTISQSTITSSTIAWVPNPQDVGGTTYPGVTVEPNDLGADGLGSTIDKYRPKITCRSAGQTRPAIYSMTLDFKPALTVPGSVATPYETQGNDTLVASSGEVTRDWRYATCSLTLDMPEDSVDTTFGAVQGNNKVAVYGGYEGSGVDFELPTRVPLQFTGHISERDMEKVPGLPGRSRVEFHCNDVFDRLSKKFWFDQGNYEGESVTDTVHRVLNQCGIPDGKISVDTAALVQWNPSTEANEDLKIPKTILGAQPKFDFPDDMNIIDGLDRMMASVGVFWGVDQTGTIFFRRPILDTEYTTGAETFVIDDGPYYEVTGDHIYAIKDVTAFGASAGDNPWVNNVLVRINRGGEEEVAWTFDAQDTPDEHKSISQHYAGAPTFIGDDWWHIFVGHDESTAQALAERILKERTTRQRTLSFRADFQPDLWPDDFLKVSNVGLNLPFSNPSPGGGSHDIYRITRKNWSAAVEPIGDGKFIAEYEARWIETVA